jgi:predicted PhzF superfamily epimerase YddE/YHI9
MMAGDDNATVVRCMHGAADGFDAAGGVAAVRWLPEVSREQVCSAAELLLSAYDPLMHTTVFVAGSAGQYVAESYSIEGERIQFCGHGALAAAWWVFNELELDASRLEFANRLHSWRARRGAAGSIVLVYQRPVPVECAVPGFAVAAIGMQADRAAETGGPTDYLILELADANQVRDARPDFDLLGEVTRRAVIATARHVVAGEPACVYRYFAPQYGNPEDAATGSAAVQLGAYWSPRLQREEFTALQLSPQGALLRLACKGDKVELAARVGYG